MQLDDFANYFNISSEIRSFIIKHNFEQVAEDLDNIPDSLENEFILKQMYHT